MIFTFLIPASAWIIISIIILIIIVTFGYDIKKTSGRYQKSRAFIFIITIISLMLVFIVPLSFLKIQTNSDTVTFSAPPFPSQTINYNEIIELKMINLNTDEQYRPVIRTGGMDLYVLSTGWYNLKNHEKAFLIITRKQYNKTIYIGTQNKSFLVTPEDADTLYEVLSKKLQMLKNR